MAQIQAKWSLSGQNLDIRGYNIGLMGQNDGPKASIGVSDYIWAILLDFGPLFFDLGYFA